jgi:hypothetical protein
MGQYANVRARLSGPAPARPDAPDRAEAPAPADPLVGVEVAPLPATESSTDAAQ